MSSDVFSSPLPASLALVDDDREYGEFLSQHLAAAGVRVVHYRDSNDLLSDHDPFRHDFYLVDLSLPGIDGLDLIRVLRKRTQVGLLVVSGRVAPEVFASVVDAGADMYLAKPVSFEQVTVAIRAVHRRVAAASGQTSSAWVLERRAACLVAPDGVRVDLSDIDVAVMECFVAADGAAVTREALCQHLGRPVTDEPDNGLSATIYRLRRRIERATDSVVPLQSLSRVGYVFRGPLVER